MSYYFYWRYGLSKKIQRSGLFFIAALAILSAPLLGAGGARASAPEAGPIARTPAGVTVPVTDPNIVYSPYNWYVSGSAYAQSPNPGAYLKMGFTGTSLSVKVDVAPLIGVSVPAPHYPLIRYSIDGREAKTVALTPTITAIHCAAGLASGSHTLLFQYVAGYVFLDFWTPVNVLRVTGFGLDSGASLVPPSGAVAPLARKTLFLGDSITNGDNTVVTFAGGITNAVETQDATVGYAPVVAAALGSEFGIVAYGGASWDSRAADGHTPGLMTFYDKLDSAHSRLVAGKISPIPDDIFVNMGENRPPSGDDVPKLLGALRAGSSPQTNIFVIVPFSGRARTQLRSGVSSYHAAAPSDVRAYLIDLGNNPYLTDSGPTMLAVDGQHPLAFLDAMLAAQIVQARAAAIGSSVPPVETGGN